MMKLMYNYTMISLIPLPISILAILENRSYAPCLQYVLQKLNKSFSSVQNFLEFK